MRCLPCFISQLPLLVLLFSCSRLLAQEGAAFHPPGMWTWDNWFAHDGERWHAFYLQLPQSLGVDRRWKNNDPFKHVGHATSTDLRHWQDQGPALTALSGTWNDRHIATGSIMRHEGEWWMFFTGRGYGGDGVGLARSKDLQTWEAQAKPLFPLVDTFADGSGAAAFQSQWRGKAVSWVGISDPYILPEKHDGAFYMVLCSRIVGEPLASSGCLTLLKSNNLLDWESAGILAWPGCFERMETPQLWKAHDRWYLYFGGVINAAVKTNADSTLPAAVKGRKSHQNYVYASAGMTDARADDDLHFIETPPGHFIMKVLPQTGGQDLAIYTVRDSQNSSISKPYPVTYLPDGWIRLSTD